MLFQQINGFVRAQQLERSFRYFSQRTVFQKCSCPSDRQYIEFSGGSNYRSKNRNDFSRGANYHSKIRGESSSKASYHSKNRADQNNRCHENAGKFRRNIVSSEISSKSHEKPGISSKFICITFAQYCTRKFRLSGIRNTSLKHLFGSLATIM